MTEPNPNSRMNLIFDESQPKYKCCCGCMTVRTGAAIIATLKALGVLMAILELFTGPHFSPGYPNDDDGDNLQPKFIKTTTTTTADPSNYFLEPQADDNAVIAATTPPNNQGLIAVRLASTIVYLMVEAVAVSCLFYALRRERPKFVVPEMALVLVCMSLELVLALLVVVAAAFGSESLVQMVVNRLRAQGTVVDSNDVDTIRRLIPFVLTALAFALLVGAAFEFWFFRVLKSFHRYLRDKEAYRGFNCGGDILQVQHHPHHGGYVNGYQPMIDESVADDLNGQQNKDMPPTYQDIVKQQESTPQAMPPPSYKELAGPPPPQQ